MGTLRKAQPLPGVQNGFELVKVVDDRLQLVGMPFGEVFVSGVIAITPLKIVHSNTFWQVRMIIGIPNVLRGGFRVPTTR